MLRRTLLILPTLACAQGSEVGGGRGIEVEVNTASRAALESLPGVGPALAGRLIAARPLRDWDDLIHRAGGVRAATARKLSSAGLRVNGQAWSDRRAKAGETGETR